MKEYADLEHRRRGPMTLELRGRLSQLRAGLLACATCGQPAVSLRNRTEPRCALCGQVDRQRRTVATMRAGSTR